jgi:hypothetical protein
MMLDSDGVLLTNDAYLTLSFANDGVEVAGQLNQLAATFDLLAPTDVWQSTILRAFQTWTSYTNADIGVVADGGQPFGSAGSDRGDKRFGDIRIAAIDMDLDIGAVSVAIDKVVGGSWAGDVLFNSNFNFQSINDLFAIALHEAGNVLGLEDSSDPLSPLHPGPIPTATVPTVTDIANLQNLYGARLADTSEIEIGEPPNDSFDTATALSLNDFTADDDDPIDEGSAPSLAYGDIGALGDVDYFKIETPENYSGPATIRLRTSGISLLAPRLSVYDADRQLIHEVASISSTGDVLEFDLVGVLSDSHYYLEVSGATGDWLGVGGFSMIITFDDINMVSADITESYADGSLRKFGQEELNDLLDADDDDDLNDDQHTDDEVLQAVTLGSRSEFAAPTRFEATGSIADAADIDFYQIRSPEPAVGAGVLTIAVRTLELGTLVPQIIVIDHDQNVVPSTVLANGDGQLIVQVAGIEADRNYYARVSAADSSGPFASGNYQLTASFGDQATTAQQYVESTLNSGVGHNLHKLYVAEPQLFHFLLEAASNSATSPYALFASVYNSSGQLAHRFSTVPGETRSSAAVLLAIGTYDIVVHAMSLNVAVAVATDYKLSGLAISDPFVSDPDDPTTHPFYNPDPSAGGVYLYPGNIPSDDPFLWDDFIASLQDPPPELTLPELVAALLGDWWSWFWAQAGMAGPPLAVNDTFTTLRDMSISTTAATGLLSNDIEPSGLAMSAVLIAAPPTGQLTLNANGSFQFDPTPGYSGVVQFIYQSTNLSQLSSPATVTIMIGTQGDYDGNGVVDDLDHGVWTSQFAAAANSPADGNVDGMVDAADYVMWRKIREAATVPPPSLLGDYNRDLGIDAADYVMWRKMLGTAATVHDGADGNGDGVVDPNDYGSWQMHVGQSAPPPAAGNGAGASSFSVHAVESTLTATGETSSAIDSANGGSPTTRVSLAANNVIAVASAPIGFSERKAFRFMNVHAAAQTNIPSPFSTRIRDEAFADVATPTRMAPHQYELPIRWLVKVSDSHSCVRDEQITCEIHGSAFEWFHSEWFEIGMRKLFSSL